MILERLKTYIDYKKISVSAFEKSIGMSNASFGKSLKTGGAIGTDKLENILNLYKDINPSWLLTGIGQMIIDKKNYTYQYEDQTNYSLIAENESNYIYNCLKETISIPIVDISVAAGVNGYINSDYPDVINNIKLPSSMVKASAQYFCVKTKGDSMAPTILDSSYVILRLLERQEWNDIPDRQIYVISDNSGKAYLKRIKNRLTKGFIVCMSDNADKSNYPNFNLQVDEINSILRAEWYISAKMPDINDTIYKRINDLEDKYDQLENRLSQLGKNPKK